MVQLSVNVNKIATLRNSRGGEVPNLIDGVDVILSAGCRGITVHPREDQRHITPEDVRAIAERLAPEGGRVEFNIEGDPRDDLLAMVLDVRPDQCTLVPVLPHEITSQAGWSEANQTAALKTAIPALKEAGIRVSLFVEALPEPIRWARSLGADRVELYTEPYARAFERGEGEREFRRYVEAATLAHELGLGINAGHDLDLDNLTLFRTLPHLDEVSIGHALISRALFVGLDKVVREYLDVLAG